MIRVTLMFLATSLTGLNIPVDLAPVALVSEGNEQAVEEVQTPAEITKEYFADIPIMIDVAWCESTLRHTDSNGNILRGVVNKGDVGVMQINEYYHLEDSQELGIDIYSIEGNLEYARHLYEKQGLKPWNSSKKCWNA